ncbi:MAG TPA: hypothetical protein DCM14_03310 [Clostridiales bacterium UBA8153]|nr:hypothetical protein [Clostridiales bacterium UBA8153]
MGGSAPAAMVPSRPGHRPGYADISKPPGGPLPPAATRAALPGALAPARPPSYHGKDSERTVAALVGQDLQRARELLGSGGASVVAVRRGELLASEPGNRLVPLLRLVQSVGPGLTGAAVADRVVGRAAALVLVHWGVAGVFGEIMSESAGRVLAGRHVLHLWGTLVPFIANPAGALCPMEAMVQDITDPGAAFLLLKSALARHL